MSVRHIAAVIDSDLKRSHRGIAIVYANSANDEDNVVALSAAKVAAGAGYEKRQAVTLTDELQLEVGSCGRPVLQHVPFDEIPEAAQVRLAAIPKRRLPKIYLMHMGCNNCIPLEVEGVQSVPVRGAEKDGLGVQAVASEPEDKPESKNRKPRVLDFPKEDRDRMWEVFVVVFGEPVGGMPNRYRMAMVDALAAEISPEEILPAQRRYRDGWPNAACNPQALINNWNTFGPAARLRDVPPEARAAYEGET